MRASRSWGCCPANSQQETGTAVLQPLAFNSANNLNAFGSILIHQTTRKEHSPAETLLSAYRTWGGKLAEPGCAWTPDLQHSEIIKGHSCKLLTLWHFGKVMLSLTKHTLKTFCARSCQMLKMEIRPSISRELTNWGEVRVSCIYTVREKFLLVAKNRKKFWLI